jgi:hypothetical protein
MNKARLEALLSVLFVLLAAVAVVWPTWIETVTGLDPDARSGGTEWVAVVVLAVSALASGALARRDFRTAARHLDPGTTS